MLEVKRSLSGLVAYGALLTALVCWSIAFFTPFWLESDFRMYGSQFKRLGLWVNCFNSLPDPNDFERHIFFVGCRWVFDPFTAGYPEIRGYLLSAFFVATQIFASFAFTLILVAFVLMGKLILCWSIKSEVRTLKLISYVLLASAFFGFLAITIFGAKGNSDPDWMPNPQHNYFSWSYGLAVVATFAEIVAAVLFAADAHVRGKKIRRMPSYQVENGREEATAFNEPAAQR
ncbi:unnamed protein product [Notodromas monacha]|uniref:Uncharacterized protein n=1 Tax=Notodromas monacha TaxID=399045 RepID=A0A7R9BKN8_9CRUS|nr:unnamed protein product [Notodromas monacha]CAG0915739.1 unnamed protein product [Notodromas monacha]